MRRIFWFVALGTAVIFASFLLAPSALAHSCEEPEAVYFGEETAALKAETSDERFIKVFNRLPHPFTIIADTAKVYNHPEAPHYYIRFFKDGCYVASAVTARPFVDRLLRIIHGVRL